MCAAVLAIAASPALSAYSHTIAATYLLLRLLRFVWSSHYMPLGEYVETCFRPSRLVTPELFDNVGPGLSCVYLFVVAWVLSIPTILYVIFCVAPFLKSVTLVGALEFAEHKGNSRCVDLLKSSAARVGRRGPEAGPGRATTRTTVGPRKRRLRVD